ncbi:hypothetical protein INR49_019617 [Caranx melampygus]|nr:hypothetical protein INR49_019617 [Caranx melampygus]
MSLVFILHVSCLLPVCPSANPKTWKKLGLFGGMLHVILQENQVGGAANFSIKIRVIQVINPTAGLEPDVTTPDPPSVRFTL